MSRKSYLTKMANGFRTLGRLINVREDYLEVTLQESDAFWFLGGSFDEVVAEFDMMLERYYDIMPEEMKSTKASYILRNMAGYGEKLVEKEEDKEILLDVLKKNRIINEDVDHFDELKEHFMELSRRFEKRGS